MWALMDSPRHEILAFIQNAVISVWPNECNLTKAHAHIDDLDEFSGTSRESEVKR
jgi:hypothetical protein